MIKVNALSLHLNVTLMLNQQAEKTKLVISVKKGLCRYHFFTRFAKKPLNPAFSESYLR